MNTQTIIGTLLSAAAFLKKPIQNAAALSVKDLFDTARYYLRRKFGADSDGAKVLELATQKPESLMRKSLLVEEAIRAHLADDAELTRLMQELAALLPSVPDVSGQVVRVAGRNNRVQVAGRDIVTTQRHVQRNVIAPDERHIDASQKRQLTGIIADVAERLAGENGRPRFSAVHKLLQQKFKISAFALLPRERFDDALAYLQQQRAIYRSRLQSRNPTAYAQDFLRAIHVRATELGWDGARLRVFAGQELGLKRPLVSLRELGPIQLKKLTAAVRQASPEPVASAAA